MNAIKIRQALGINNEELTLPSFPSPLKWLGESMMNVNRNTVIAPMMK